MPKILTAARPVHDRGQSLPLFAYADRRRWDDASPAARMIRRRCGIESPALARAVAELAGFPMAEGSR